MHDFRVYHLNREQKVAKATWVHCDSLEQAIEQVAARSPETTCEIWDRAQRLATVVPQPSARYRSY
jgi:hypothetical protein